jgi:shikimate dehydrogenase
MEYELGIERESPFGFAKNKVKKMLITGETGVFCIIGYPIAHSLSPAIHNAGFEANRLNLVYVPFALHPDNFEEGIKGLQALGVKGATVTVPLKELAYNYVDEKDEYAMMTGAVNTILFDQGKMKGFNLDVAGVKYSLEKLELREDVGRVVVLGAGGAARAVIAALILHRVKNIVILNRNEAKAFALKEFFAEKTNKLSMAADKLDTKSLRKYLTNVDLLVNTTPIGMYPNGDASPIPTQMIPEGIKILDAVYRPRKTKLLALAEQRKCKTLCGLDWLIHQGMLAFNIWTGKKLNKDTVMNILETHLYKPGCDG